MWFWLMLILAVALVASAICMWRYDDCSGLTLGLTILCVIAIIVVLIMGICIIDAHTNIDAKIAANEQIYDSLVYQLENELYENDNDLGKKELYNQVQEWNKDLAYNQNAQDDFWNGIFYPNIFDQFEYIILPKSVS